MASAFVVHLRVEHGQKVRGELAVRAFDGEVFLVVAHHRDQHLFRQGKVLGLEIAQHHGGPLGEMDDSLDERLIFTPARAGNGAGRGVESLADRMPALGHIGDDKCLAQRFGVVCSLVDDHRRLAVQHAMAAACIPGGDPRDLQWNNRRIHQRDQPAHRPDKTLGLTGAPVHILGPVEA